MAVICFLACFGTWLPGAVLISIADERSTDNVEYLIGFIMMLVAAGFGGLGFLIGCCAGGCKAAEHVTSCC